MKNIKEQIEVLLNLFNAAEFDSLISKAKKLIRKYPEYIILYNILGSAYQNSGRLNLAKKIFIQGNKLDSNNIAIMNNLANVYKNTGLIENAESLFNKIIIKNPKYINAYINYGNLKRDNNDFESAINFYQAALKIDDKIPVITYSLALAHQGLGEFDLAIKYAKETLLLDSNFTQADLLISQSTKYEKNHTHYKEMILKIQSAKLNENQKVNLLFALAKAEEDMNFIDKSFKNLKLGNATKRKSLNFDIDNEIKLFDQIKKIFAKVKFDNIKNNNTNTKNIIFILGMPRSGTSLVEQIISSHTNVFGAGELPQLSRIIKDNLIIEGDLSEDKIFEIITNEASANILKNVYYDSLKRFNFSQDFITDKAPLNFRWIGLIKILFPTAKIIHCFRNPKDNCLSLYKNLFEGGLDFSYSQKELGIYYNLYLDLMNFWKNTFPNTIYQANYEKIIENSEYEIKRIIKFCDLKWEDSCLSFYKNKTPIKTMSTAQARQPIYKSSVNSFNRFLPYLDILDKKV
jgi:tetratricopeptide (TPR) repeat protein